MHIASAAVVKNISKY